MGDDERDRLLARLERRLARERAAREEAEALLEAKSRELWDANQALEARVEERTADLRVALEGAEERAAALITEQRIAERIFARMASRNAQAPECIKSYVSAQSVFNGDTLLVAHTPSGQTRVLVGDFTGHGLPASLGTIPMFDTFHSMTAKSFPIPRLVEELNAKLRVVLPTGFFCAAIVFEVDPVSRLLRVWNGGMHDLLVRAPDGGLMHRVKSKNMALGILNEGAFDGSEEIYPLEPGARILGYSDGVIEAERDGVPFGAEALESLFLSDVPHAEFVDRLRADMQAYLECDEQKDDITVIDLLFDATVRIPEAATDRGQRREGGTWYVAWHLEASALRRSDPVPGILQAVFSIEGIESHREPLFLIVRELFANALDHGVLRLDSGWKSTPDGFARFYGERQTRLAALAQATIQIGVDHAPDPEGGRLTVTIEDSGEGFDREHARQVLEDSGGHAGRGLSLIEELCEAVKYEAGGKRVVATYRWTHGPA